MSEDILNKLFGGSSYNKVYDILNTMRNTKKFDYVCSVTENDTNFLDLTCEEATILKIILKINLKQKDNKLEFIKDNKLDTSLLNKYLIHSKKHLIIGFDACRASIKKIFEARYKLNKMINIISLTSYSEEVAKKLESQQNRTGFELYNMYFGKHIRQDIIDRNELSDYDNQITQLIINILKSLSYTPEQNKILV
jgi:hypothetical protein